MNRRQTIQRQLVLDTLRRDGTHPTAQHLLEEIRKTYPSISLGTVYNNLRLLAEEGTVRVVTLPGSPDRFDGMTQPHDHIRCRCCGKLLDLPVTPVSPISRYEAEATGFSVEGYDLIFSGVCPDCMTAAEEMKS